MNSYITDSLILGHVMDDGSSNFPFLIQDQFAISPSNSYERHLQIWSDDQREFNFNWKGVDSAFWSLYLFWRSVYVSEYFYFYVPVSEPWTGVDVACGFPQETTAMKGGEGYVTGAFTGVSKAADAVVTVANTFENIADNVYVYITGVVDDGPGGDFEAALNNKLHKITEFTGAASFKIATDTSGCVNAWASGGTAALATFIIQGRSTSAWVAKEDGGAAKTEGAGNDFTVAAGEGIGDEDVIQCTTSWIPASGKDVTCGFTGRRRYCARFTNNRLDCKKSNGFIGAERLVISAIGLREMKG